MHTQGHSAGDGLHGARRQQYRVWDSAKKQQGRHILGVDSYPEVQTEFGAVPGLKSSDRLAARHRVTH
jgi:hypothetical protein